MQAAQRVAALRKRLEHLFVAKALCQRQMLLVLRQRVHIAQHLIHAAVLGAKHPLELIIGHVVSDVGRPIGELDKDVLRQIAAGDKVCMREIRP